MSTKFRQSFLRLCDECRSSSKYPHSSSVLFCKEYATRPILMRVNRDGFGGSMSTTGATSYHQSNLNHSQERKLLLTDNTPTPLTTTPIDIPKFIFP